MERLTNSGTKEAKSNVSIRQVLNRLAEYEDLEEQGLLPKLPCKVGDKLYQATRDFVSIFAVRFIEISTCHNLFIHTCLVNGVNMTGDVFRQEEIGKTIFLTQAEAEEALQEHGKK